MGRAFFISVNPCLAQISCVPIIYQSHSSISIQGLNLAQRRIGLAHEHPQHVFLQAGWAKNIGGIMIQVRRLGA